MKLYGSQCKMRCPKVELVVFRSGYDGEGTILARTAPRDQVKD